ncbi:hypothetical protein D3C71_1162030 [compost metagenome]
MRTAPGLQRGGQALEALPGALVVAGRLRVQLGDHLRGGLFDRLGVRRAQPHQPVHVQHAPLHARGRTLRALVGLAQPVQCGVLVAPGFGQLGQFGHVVIGCLATVELGQQQPFRSGVIAGLAQHVGRAAEGGLALMRGAGGRVGRGHARLRLLAQGLGHGGVRMLLLEQGQFGGHAGQARIGGVVLRGIRTLQRGQQLRAEYVALFGGRRGQRHQRRPLVAEQVTVGTHFGRCRQYRRQQGVGALALRGAGSAGLGIGGRGGQGEQGEPPLQRRFWRSCGQLAEQGRRIALAGQAAGIHLPAVVAEDAPVVLAYPLRRHHRHP